MIQMCCIHPNEHWAVGLSADNLTILVQTQDKYGAQARVRLTVEQAATMGEWLINAARKAEANKAARDEDDGWPNTPS